MLAPRPVYEVSISTLMDATKAVDEIFKNLRRNDI